MTHNHLAVKETYSFEHFSFAKETYNFDMTHDHLAAPAQ